MLRDLITVKIFFMLFISSFLCSQSNQQINQAKKIVKDMKLSKTEATNAAKSNGYTQAQINKVIKKNNSNAVIKDDNLEKVNLKDEILIKDQSNIINLDKNVTEESFEEEAEFILKNKSEQKIKKLSYFGYDIFNRNPELFQGTTVGAIDPNYLIGPQDQIIVMLWGETQFRQVFTVDREGFIFIPEIGQVFVNGLSLILLESKLFKVFSKAYASLNPLNKNSTTFLDVSLGNLRPLSIQVLGEVAQPGYYTVNPSTTLFSALYYFNGPTTLGSLRDIQLIRSGKKIASIDFYDYLLTGKKPNDQKLQLNDVIFIPRRLKTVSIQGEINKEGIFELKPNESLIDLINIAGDLKMTAYLDRSQIDRIVPFDQRAELEMDRMYIDVNLNTLLGSKKSFPVKNNDQVQVFSILDERQNIVEINGAVSRPGVYDLGNNLFISDLIEKADGLLGDSYNSRAEIVRIKPDFNEVLIKVDLAQVLKGDVDHDILLQSLDKVKIYQMSRMVSDNYVSLQGYVKNPGSFLLLENMTAYDLIFQNGGFIDEEFKSRAYLEIAYLYRYSPNQTIQVIKKFNLSALLEDPNSKNNFFLMPNDVIKVIKKNIFTSPQSVEINGAVKSKGQYAFKQKMTLKDLIIESGGLNQNGHAFNVEIARKDSLNTDLNSLSFLMSLTIDNNFNILSFINDDYKNKNFSPPGDFFLEPDDVVSIRSNPFFSVHDKIIITGAVVNPGTYVILNRDEKISDIIERAGGVLDIAYLRGSTYERAGEKLIISLIDILKNPESDFNFNVQDSDFLTIPYRPNFIRVIGEVNSPGIHKFTNNKSVKYFLSIAGGLNNDADTQNIWIEYPNGSSIAYNKKFFFNTPVYDGSTIRVGKKEKGDPFDKTEYIKELTSILANLSQAITVIFLATK
jgi:polysaccharide biosynthesis/export protein